MKRKLSARTDVIRRGLTSWKGRHLAALALGLAVTYAFEESRSQWSEMHRWNRAAGDASLVLIAFSMAIGPLARLWPRTRFLIPWRREFGIWGVVLALVHTVIILGGWVEWNLIRILGYEFHPGLRQYVMLQHGFGFANIVGVLAVLYGIVLALTSNDRSQRYLGGPVWKFLQQSSYVLWAFILLHTAYFLYLHFQHFDRPTPAPNWFQIPFALLVALIAALQIAASWKTWRARKKRLERPGAATTSESLA